MARGKKNGANYQSSKPHPYVPKGRTYGYVLESNAFIRRAKSLGASMRKKFPKAIITASVLVKNGDVIGKGINNPIHPSFCPRTVFQCPSGEGYELCPSHCHSDNHSEGKAIKEAKEKKRDARRSDLYLYGHWWCCKPCWDKIIAAGISNVYLVEGATEKFSMPVSGKGELLRPFSYYAASAITRVKGDRLKIFHKELRGLLGRVNIHAYLPWLYTDPVAHPHLSPSAVYKKNTRKISESDFVLAYLGEPSLGVGQELEIAHKYQVPVVGLAKRGEQVSRMTLGAPSLRAFFYFEDTKDVVVKLSEALARVFSQKSLRKSTR